MGAARVDDDEHPSGNFGILGGFVILVYMRTVCE